VTAEILIVKTAALGDVLRTTAILPGLSERHAPCRITWLTAPGAVDLVRTHPLVDEVLTCDVRSPASLTQARATLAARRFARVISLDDEEPLCALVAGLSSASLSGATLDARGARVYTDDVAPWFDMGLLSRFGKAEADRLKIANRLSQPALYAAMLGIRLGRPALELTPEARAFAAGFAARHELDRHRPLIGLNTGAGGRWTSKQLSVERTVDFARALGRALPHGSQDGPRFLVLGGESEAERNQAIVAGLAEAGLAVVDGGTRNPLLEFAGLVGLCDLLLTSDSLALHMAIAQAIPVVAFFAPTSAAEIELYGCGEKVQSTAPDYCCYRPDADNTTLTTERLVAAALRQLAEPARPRSPRTPGAQDRAGGG